MELSYDEIRRIHRLERNSSKLVQVDSEFYNSLSEFLSAEKKDYLDSLKDFSSAKTRDFSNLKKMVEEIFSMRVKKILNAVLVASRTSEIDDSRMATQEKKMFKEIFSIMKKHTDLVDGVFASKAGSSKEGKDLNNLSVRVLSDIPEFIGTDMNEYGPYKKGEVVDLPLKIMKLLSEKKFVEAL